VNHSIKIERADNARRSLHKGYVWQPYRVAAVKTISKMAFEKMYNGRTSNLVESHREWENTVHSYICRRSDTLGLWVGGVVGQLVEEPNENKELEVIIWSSRDVHCVFSIWAILNGPVPSDNYNEEALPLFAFWPWELQRVGGIPELVDANILTAREQDG
tara:strand:- start:633 stop:1112 length:480 start_codon:yes stop_codon:yes gene_type:complete